MKLLSVKLQHAILIIRRDNDGVSKAACSWIHLDYAIVLD